MQQSTGPITSIRDWLRSDMRNLRWVFLGLYALLVGGLLVLTFIDQSYFVAVMVAILLVSQALFIFGGGTIQLCYPIRKRRLWMPFLVTVLMGLLLVAGLLAALVEFFYLDPNSSFHAGPLLIFVGLFATWMLWAMLLWRFVRDRERRTAMGRMTGVLIGGSLAELVACVPAHVVVSRRPGCLVGLWTMLGIVAGIYVMLFAFGPAIVLLFLRPRYRREQMEAGLPLCAACGYDLRGTLAASRTQCPECGQAITAAQQRSGASIKLA